MRKLLLILVVVPAIVFGQVNQKEDLKKEIIIEGNVSDMHGVSLTSVAVLVKGKSNVIKTNFDGNFKLKSEIGTVLVISSAGFNTTEITVGNQSKIKITLIDSVKSEKTKALAKSDYRKKRRADKKARRDSRRGKNANTVDLNDELLKAVGRSIKGAIKKHSRNN